MVVKLSWKFPVVSVLISANLHLFFCYCRTVLNNLKKKMVFSRCFVINQALFYWFPQMYFHSFQFPNWQKENPLIVIPRDV